MGSGAAGAGDRQQQQAGMAAAATAGAPASATKSALFDDASSEIADIDSRLHALQSFLRMAKGGGGGTGG